MRKLLLVCIMFLSINAFAQTAQQLIEEGKKLETQLKDNEAYDKFELAIEKDLNNDDAYTRASFLASKIGERQKDAALKKSYYSKAMIYAQKAVKLNDKNADAHFVYAVALGRQSLMAGSEEKLKNARLIKVEAERAIALDPKNAGAYHILARLNGEIANMSSIKVMAAKALYGGVPEGCTFEKAEAYHLKSIEYRPNYILFYYDAAVNYDRMGKKDKAIAMLKKGVATPMTTLDDPYRVADCKKMLAKYKE